MIPALAILFGGGTLALHHTSKASSIPVVNVSGDLNKVFKTVSDLKNNAPLIIEAEVVKGTSFEYNHVIFTKNNLLVKKVYKGDLQGKQNIDILETGGISDNKEFVLEGNPVSKPGEKLVLFLKKYDGPVTEDAYTIEGAYQGKFTFDDGKKISFKKANEKFGELQSIQSINDLQLDK
ncbi:hypothetical protein J2Z69_001010 [Paenibacillus shirakamiensis]|uniref:Lipoprotein n=1 Tax=Paenibacillus shirakamiensis TaxID=1265935 RepID=A0ABS4JG89_9BACL|nr:hypothetical protein [Paenibacillus shirakamiensis]